MSISPLAPIGFPSLEPIAGVQLSSVPAGIKYQGRDDVMLAVFESGTTVAGVFTQSMTAGAPVMISRSHLQSRAAPKALIVNSGNSNAFTGKKGEQAVLETCQAVADAIDCQPQQVYVASTGVIGELIPKQRIFDVIPQLVRELGDNNWEASAKAIMTTDTFPKGATVKTQINGKTITINGFAKGSGMIAPDMATMLAFVYTDAAIPGTVLQALLAEANEQSFNSITVDSDTSTSDTCLLFATGNAGNDEPSHINDEGLQSFRIALAELMRDLAVQVVRDGEGATKLIKVRVTGAADHSAAKVVAKSIADSPLVKTAIAGEDANWGRVVMAVGKSGEMADRDKLRIKMGGVLITEQGELVEGYDEAPVATHLKGQEVTIETDLGIGDGSATVWTCDLTHGYIQINADYRS